MRGSIARPIKAAGRSAKSCLNHGCAAALGGPSEDQRGRLSVCGRTVTYYTVWPITAKVKVWPLLRHVLEYACACDVRQRGARARGGPRGSSDVAGPRREAGLCA